MKMIINTQNYPKIDTYIKRKISLSLTFQIHHSSLYAQAFHRFFVVVVLQKGEQRLLEKDKKHKRFPG